MSEVKESVKELIDLIYNEGDFEFLRSPIIVNEIRNKITKIISKMNLEVLDVTDSSSIDKTSGVILAWIKALLISPTEARINPHEKSDWLIKIFKWMKDIGIVEKDEEDETNWYKLTYYPKELLEDSKIKEFVPTRLTPLEQMSLKDEILESQRQIANLKKIVSKNQIDLKETIVKNQEQIETLTKAIIENQKKQEEKPEGYYSALADAIIKKQEEQSNQLVQIPKKSTLVENIKSKLKKLLTWKKKRASIPNPEEIIQF